MSTHISTIDREGRHKTDILARLSIVLILALSPTFLAGDSATESNETSNKSNSSLSAHGFQDLPISAIRSAEMPPTLTPNQHLTVENLIFSSPIRFEIEGLTYENTFILEAKNSIDVALWGVMISTYQNRVYLDIVINNHIIYARPVNELPVAINIRIIPDENGVNRMVVFFEMPDGRLIEDKPHVSEEEIGEITHFVTSVAGKNESIVVIR